MRVVVIGANGQLGTDLTKVLSEWDPVAFAHNDVDICDFPRVRKAISDVKPDAVINTAACTRVDECENDVQGTFRVNAHAVRNLAQVCADLNSSLVHISTNYVFGGEGQTPFKENDIPNPLNVYGISKLAGEYFVRNLCANYLIVRSSGLYGAAGSKAKGGNFVDTMIRLAKEERSIRVVIDQILTPTYTKDLAEKIKELLKRGAYGLFHVTNSGQCSWYEFASKIFEFLGLEPDLRRTTATAYEAKARRPAYSVLARDKLSELGLADLRPWPNALRAYLGEKGYLVS